MLHNRPDTPVDYVLAHVMKNTLMSLWFICYKQNNVLHAGIFVQCNEIVVKMVTVVFKVLVDLEKWLNLIVLHLDPNSQLLFISWRVQFIKTSMGHFVSRSKQMDLSSMPQGHISFAEELSRQYPSQEGGTVGAIPANGTSGDFSISMEWETPRQSSEHQNSKQECQRPSIYSPMDAVPHLEFYTNSIGRQRRSRPSMEILRNVSEVSNHSTVFFIWSFLIDLLNTRRSNNSSRLKFHTLKTIHLEGEKRLHLKRVPCFVSLGNL